MKTQKKELESWQRPSATPYLELVSIEKEFNGVQALTNLNLSVYKGEFFSLLGESGCGKTTLLRILAGFETPSSGSIYIDGINITHMPAYKRPVNMMFQSYALFPHMTVYQNVAFGLQQESFTKKEIYSRVMETLSLIKMTHLLDRKPHQLSGGQRQRVALSRSLVKRPKLLLLDEPLAALDKKLREQTQFELVNIQESLGMTFIMVTHDQEEAMTMSSRMAIMNEGKLQQIGAPYDIYEYPKSKFVAEFIGSTNIFEGTLIDEEDDTLTIESKDIDVPIVVNHAGTYPVGTHVHIAIRPEKMFISRQKPIKSQNNYTKGIVKEIAYLGDMSIYHVKIASGKMIQAALPNLLRLAERDVKWDDEVYLIWNADNGVVLTS
jgi:putrescine transport system ATP-binding protein